MRFVVAVPARLESSRLPGKVMADIGGRPMLRRVLERCALARRPAAVVLCADSPSLIEAAAAWGFPALLTPADCSSGSDRLASALPAILDFAGGEGEAARAEEAIAKHGGELSALAISMGGVNSPKSAPGVRRRQFSHKAIIRKTPPDFRSSDHSWQYGMWVDSV